jgi:hypothetical protein
MAKARSGGPELARRRIELRYDPEVLELIEVWYKGQFVERVRPFQVHAHRRPKPAATAQDESVDAKSAPEADYLGHLVAVHRDEGRVEPSPKALAAAAQAARAAAGEAIVALLAERLDPAVVDVPAIRDFCERYGPFDADEAEQAIAPFVARGLTDQHISIYLDAIWRHQPKGPLP